MKIERDLLNELIWLKPGEDMEDYTVVANYHLENKRWTELSRIVVKHKDSPGIWAFDYETALADGEYDWNDWYKEEIEMFPVTARAETVMYYDKI